MVCFQYEISSDAGPSEAPESSHSVEEGESKGESDEEYEIESSDESEEGGYSDVESGECVPNWCLLCQ